MTEVWISIDFDDFASQFTPYVLIEKMWQTLETVFHQQSKHRILSKILCRTLYFNSQLGVWYITWNTIYLYYFFSISLHFYWKPPFWTVKIYKEFLCCHPAKWLEKKIPRGLQRERALADTVKFRCLKWIFIHCYKRKKSQNSLQNHPCILSWECLSLADW